MMNPPETRSTELFAPREPETVTDRTKILHEYAQTNSANVSVGKIVKRFLIKRQEKIGT